MLLAAASLSSQAFSIDDARFHFGNDRTLNEVTDLQQTQPKQTLTEISNELYGTAPLAASSNPSTITEPKGLLKNFLQSGERWTYFLGMFNVNEPYQNTATNIVFGDDDAIYIKNIITGYPTESYIEGKLVDGVATFTFPQTIQVEKTQGEIREYKVMRLDMVFVGDFENEATFEPAEDQTVTFTLADDGSFVMEPSEEGEWMLGLTNTYGNWLGYGDYNIVLTPNNYAMVELPDGLQIEKWQLISNYTGHYVNMAFDGEDVYIQGICTFLPESWVKAKMENGKIVYEGAQYIGDITAYSTMAFVMPGDRPIAANGKPGYALADKTVFDFDADSKTLTTEGSLVVNGNPDTLKFVEFFYRPMLHPDSDNHSLTPQDIVPVAYAPYSEENKAGGYQFYIPNLSIDNYILDKDRMYWQLYVDDELYVFEPYLYDGFEVDTTDVPYNIDCFDLFNGGSPLHELHFFFIDPTSLGVQVYYLDDNGEKHFCEHMVVYEPTPTGIDEAINDAEANAPKEYFDIYGRRLSQPVPGTVCIVRQGNKANKVIVK